MGQYDLAQGARLRCTHPLPSHTAPERQRPLESSTSDLLRERNAFAVTQWLADFRLIQTSF
jgi:hypothetical protein